MGLFAGLSRLMPPPRSEEQAPASSPASVLFEHTDPASGRVFHVTVAVRETDEGVTRRFFVTELCPNGQMLVVDQRIVEAPILLELEARSGPNGFLAAAESVGITAERIVMVAMGSLAGAAFASIDDAVDAIAACLAGDRRFHAFCPLEDVAAIRLAQQRAAPGDREDWLNRIRAWASEVPA